MPRVKRAVHARKKRAKVLDQAKGYYGRKKSSYRFAKEQVEHSLVVRLPRPQGEEADVPVALDRAHQRCRARERPLVQPVHGRREAGGDRARPQVARRPRGLGPAGVRRRRRAGEGRARGRLRLRLSSSLITSRQNEKLRLVRKLLSARKHRRRAGFSPPRARTSSRPRRPRGSSPSSCSSQERTSLPELLGGGLDARPRAACRRRLSAGDLPAARATSGSALWRVGGSRQRRHAAAGRRRVRRLRRALGRVRRPARARGRSGRPRARSSAFRSSTGTTCPERRVALVAHGGRRSRSSRSSRRSPSSSAPSGRACPTIWAGEQATIALPGDAESLNVAAAGAIALYELSRRSAPERVDGLLDALSTAGRKLATRVASD